MAYIVNIIKTEKKKQKQKDSRNRKKSIAKIRSGNIYDYLRSNVYITRIYMSKGKDEYLVKCFLFFFF